MPTRFFRATSCRFVVRIRDRHPCRFYPVIVEKMESDILGAMANLTRQQQDGEG